jgi:hypothetical protein
MRACNAAAFLLAMRLFPSALSLVIVAGLCLPGYLRFEPEGSAEEVGVVCFTAAALGLVAWGLSLTRTARAAWASRCYLRQCRSTGREIRLAGDASPVWIMDVHTPLLAVAGVLRPRLVISPTVLHTLSGDQLAAALRHERAHEASRDNFKRLLILLAPGVLPWRSGPGSLEHAWTRFTEWAADDRAAAGDEGRSLSLAAALVQVARMGAAGRPSPLATALLSDSADLSARVDRLIAGIRHDERPDRAIPLFVAMTSLAGASLLGVMLSQPSALSSVHELLELLIH